jgi:replication initiator protein
VRRLAFCRDLSEARAFNPAKQNGESETPAATKERNPQRTSGNSSHFRPEKLLHARWARAESPQSRPEKYRLGQTEPILIGGAKALKTALQLNVFRLRIDEIKEGAVLTSYSRWLESIQVKGTENPEVYVTFSPQFERIWLESKKRLPEYVAKEPSSIGLRSQYSIRLYAWAKKWASVGTKRISLEELRKVLGLEPVQDVEGNVIQEPPLPIWANFRQRALDVGIAEINKKTDLKVSIGSIERAKHRKVTFVTFSIEERAVPKDDT